MFPERERSVEQSQQQCSVIMGFPALSNVSAGLFAVLMITMAALKDLLASALQIWRGSTSSVILEEQPRAAHSPQGPGLALPSMWSEICFSLPTASYDASIVSADSVDIDHAARCAICLLDFVRGDCIHLLPRCSHVFHRGCIDRWLEHQHSTCPLCRSSLIPEDLAWKYHGQEQELVEELILWFSSFHGSAFHGLWWQT